MLKNNHFVVLMPEEEKNSSASSSPVSSFTPIYRARKAQHFEPEKRVIAMSESTQLAQQRTEQRLKDLLKATTRLNKWLQEDIFFDKETVHILEYMVIKICEILHKLRENFSGWHYYNLVRETVIQNTHLIPSKIIRNKIVHEDILLKDEDKFELYLKYARYLATLHDYKEGTPRQALDFKDFINFEDAYAKRKPKPKELAYTDEVQAKLTDLFEDIAYYGNTVDHSLLTSIARATEIIRQLRNDDPNVKITIHGQVIKSKSIDYFLQVRKGVHHYNQAFETSSVTEIVRIAQSVCQKWPDDEDVAKIQKRNYTH
jgi:hypothetical protein